MAEQGWTVNALNGTINFYLPPAAGSAIAVSEYGGDGRGGTNVWAVGSWSPRFGYPQEVEFYSDRLWFAGTPSDPQTLWASEIGNYSNFGKSSPIVDSDAVSFAINSRQVNAVRDLVPLDSLLVLTTGGEHRVTGGQDDVITPSTIGVKPQSNAGTGDIPARVIGDSAIFIQNEGQKVRDLSYQFEKDGFRGNDISVWADHFFAGYSITATDYWKAPWQVVWFIRNDGIRLGCTYMPEQEVIGWHRHDTDGKFLDACTLPGDLESSCYYLVQREVDGRTVQYIEEQAATRFDTESDLFYVDSGLKYDGRMRSGSTLTISGSDWTEDFEVDVSSSTDVFSGISNVGDGLKVYKKFMTVVDDEIVTMEVSANLQIAEFIGPRSVKARIIGTVPDPLRNSQSNTWDFQRSTIAGLEHLEGKSVIVLQDAAVVGPYLVVDGKIELDSPGGVVIVGIPYTAEIETLELNNPGGEPMRDQSKLTYSVSILLLASRGVWAGAVGDREYPIPERTFENYGQPPYLKTGIFDSPIPTRWGIDAGRVRVLSKDPLPMEILSLTVRAVASNAQAAGTAGRS